MIVPVKDGAKPATSAYFFPHILSGLNSVAGETSRVNRGTRIHSSETHTEGEGWFIPAPRANAP